MDVIEILGEITKKWGLVAGFHFLLFSTIIYILIHKTINGKTLWNKLFNKTKTKYNLSNHVMFVNLRKYINYDIKHFTLGERLREAIFRDFLLIKFTIVEDEFKKVIEDNTLELMSNEVYSKRMLDCIVNIVKLYEIKAKEAGIPDIAITRFTEWYDDKVQAIYAFIINVCEDTDIYNDNNIKTKVIFDFMNHINNFTILGIRKVLLDFNGELSKLTYKGITYNRYGK